MTARTMSDAGRIAALEEALIETMCRLHVHVVHCGTNHEDRCLALLGESPYVGGVNYGAVWEGLRAPNACRHRSISGDMETEGTMSQNLSPIICNACGKDVTSTGNCEDWRLALTAQAKLPWYVAEGLGGGMVTTMAIPKPLNGTKHFCDLGCLEKWIGNRSTSA